MDVKEESRALLAVNVALKDYHEEVFALQRIYWHSKGREATKGQMFLDLTV